MMDKMQDSALVIVELHAVLGRTLFQPVHLSLKYVSPCWCVHLTAQFGVSNKPRAGASNWWQSTRHSCQEATSHTAWSFSFLFL